MPRVQVPDAVQAQVLCSGGGVLTGRHSVSCYCSGFTASRGSSLKSTKLLEVLSALEDGSGHQRKEIVIAPPDSAVGDFTDEDSGDEDGQPGAQLPSHVLHASVLPEDDGSWDEEDPQLLVPLKR